MSSQHRVRLCRSSGEIEVEGPADFVEAWFERLWEKVKEVPYTTARSSPQGADSPASTVASVRTSTATADTQQGTQDVSESFGEYFARFRSGLKANDHALIAASFVQAHDSDNLCTTREINQALLEQNVKLGNPSEAMRQLVQYKRAFKVGKKFRVSNVGFDYLRTLELE